MIPKHVFKEIQQISLRFFAYVQLKFWTIQVNKLIIKLYLIKMFPFQSQTFSFTKLLAKELIEPTPRDLFSDVKDKLKQLDEAQENCKDQQEKQYLRIYTNVLQKLSFELSQVKNKYKNIDKSKLRDEKCLSLASEINFFRQQCNYLKSKIAQSKETLKKQKLKQQVLKRQTEAIQHNISASKEKSIVQKQRFKVLQQAVKTQIDNMTEKGRSKFKTRSFFAYTPFDTGQRGTTGKLQQPSKLFDKSTPDGRFTGFKNRKHYWKALQVPVQNKFYQQNYAQIVDLPLDLPTETRKNSKQN